MSADLPTLAIDLGGSKVLAALVAGGQVLERAEAATDREAGPTVWVAQMAGMAQGFAGRFDRAGIAVTGLVKDGMWSALNPGTLAIPGQFPLREAAEAALGVPVTLRNDAQAAAWGEYRHGAGQGLDLVFLTLSTGIGGGVVTGGRLLQGRGGLAGSFGQLLPLPEGEAVRFEDAASGRWMAEVAKRDARAVFAAAAEPWAEAILATAARRVARLCHDLQLMFDPDVIVIGGGVGLAPGQIGRIAGFLADLPAVQRPTLVPAALGKDAGVIGIAALTTRNQATERTET